MVSHAARRTANLTWAFNSSITVYFYGTKFLLYPPNPRLRPPWLQYAKACSLHWQATFACVGCHVHPSASRDTPCRVKRDQLNKYSTNTCKYLQGKSVNTVQCRVLISCIMTTDLFNVRTVGLTSRQTTRSSRAATLERSGQRKQNTERIKTAGDAQNNVIRLWNRNTEWRSRSRLCSKPPATLGIAHKWQICGTFEDKETASWMGTFSRHRQNHGRSCGTTLFCFSSVFSLAFFALLFFRSYTYKQLVNKVPMCTSFHTYFVHCAVDWQWSFSILFFSFIT